MWVVHSILLRFSSSELLRMDFHRRVFLTWVNEIETKFIEGRA